MGKHPVRVFVFSGKRKSGKDYVTDLLRDMIGKERCCILRLSEPLKGQYAEEHGLDLNRLLDSSGYKETYRSAMIVWGEERRRADPGYFCRLVTAQSQAQLPVWIVSDARRKTDVEYFKTEYSECVVTVKVVADDAVRATRGWKFICGVDDTESECGLDDVPSDVTISNNGDHEALREQLLGLWQAASVAL